MDVSIRRPGAGRFVARLALEPDTPTDGYPFDLPVVRALRDGGVALPAGVTFVVGENGSGKSTLVEALAVALGLNAEGGSRSFRFASRASESELGSWLRVTRRPGRERRSYFLRAESFYNLATEIEDPELGVLAAYGGVSPHERSHGQSFLDLLRHRFGPRGLYLLDEPEAALSVAGCLAALARMAELVAQGGQLVVATHSPILLALPGAHILQLDADGDIAPVTYDDADLVVLTRRFLDRPQVFLRELGLA